METASIKLKKKTGQIEETQSSRYKSIKENSLHVYTYNTKWKFDEITNTPA